MMIARPKVMERNLKKAKKIAEENGGKLPNPWKMIQMGQGSLYRYIKRHPKEFSQFQFEKAHAIDKKRKTVFSVTVRDKHLKTAMELAKKHHGLPNFTWLNTHGYSRLAAYIRAYPELFQSLDCIPKKKQV